MYTCIIYILYVCLHILGEYVLVYECIRLPYKIETALILSTFSKHIHITIVAYMQGTQRVARIVIVNTATVQLTCGELLQINVSQ